MKTISEMTQEELMALDEQVAKEREADHAEQQAYITRKRHHWSGSRTSLLSHCAYSARPDVELPPRESSEAADAGTAKHEVFEACASGKYFTPEAVAKRWPGHDPERVSSNINGWIPRIGNALTECPIAYRPETGEAMLLVSNGQRDYSAAPDDAVPMTLDHCHASGTEGQVDDWKTGRQDNTPPAERNGQMRLAALAWARLNHLDSVTATLWFVDDDGSLRGKSTARFDAFDLDDIEAEMRAIWRAIGTSAEPNPGPWCAAHWCNARTVCPAMTRAIVGTPAEPLSLRIETAEQAARIHSQLSLAEEFLSAVKKELHRYVRECGAVELADGSKLDLVSKSRETVQAIPRVRDVLEKEGLSEAIEWSTSKAAIERAIKATAERGTAAGRMRELMETLQATGGVSVSTFEAVDVVKPKAAKGKRAA